MGVQLVMRPQDAAMSREQFIATTPPFSIAIDGYVKEGPWYQAEGPRYNFNHHEGVMRLETRATCAQVLMAIRMGLFCQFRDGNGPRANVYANDCDEDVCVAWALLHNKHLAEPPMNPRLNRLVHMADMLDTAAGAYPFPVDLPLLQEMAWIFDPYRQFRSSGQLAKRDPKAFVAVVEDVELRIKAHLYGEGKALPIDARYERIGGGPGWALVIEHGAQARMAMATDGIRAFIAVRDRGNGRYDYTGWRMSEFIPVPIDALPALMNEAEQITTEDKWGGATTVIGSPRNSGSSTSPHELQKLFNAHIAKHSS